MKVGEVNKAQGCHRFRDEVPKGMPIKINEIDNQGKAKICLEERSLLQAAVFSIFCEIPAAEAGG